MAAKPWTVRPKVEQDLSVIQLYGVEIWGVGLDNYYQV